MKYQVPQAAIDNLTELALYSEHCWIANTIDDELYNLLMQGLDGLPSPRAWVPGYDDEVERRMYFLFMAEMLKTPWKPRPLWKQALDQKIAMTTRTIEEVFAKEDAPKQKTPFDGVAWLFENHWITYADVLRVREAQRQYEES